MCGGRTISPEPVVLSLSERYLRAFAHKERTGVAFIKPYYVAVNVLKFLHGLSYVSLRNNSIKY